MGSEVASLISIHYTGVEKRVTTVKSSIIIRISSFSVVGVLCASRAYAGRFKSSFLGSSYAEEG